MNHLTRSIVVRAKPAIAAVNGVRAARRGYRFGGELQPAIGDGTAADPDSTSQSGALEAYFDDHTEGAGIWKWRHYFPIYERHFAKFVGREVHVVEIGIFSGGSLGMWRHYFGPRSCVYGVDIEPDCRGYEADGIRVFVGDQADPTFWRSFREEVPVVDVIIDDGGHEAHQQIGTLEGLLPHLQPGGVYMCEDVHGRFHAFHAYIDGLCRPLNEVGGPAAPIHQHIESVHRYPLATVIEKPGLPVPAFEAPRHGTHWQPFL